MLYGSLVKNNEYLLFNMLGKGAYSDVWLAYSISKKTFVALKLMMDADDVDVCDQESEMLRKLSKTSVGILLDHFTNETVDGRLISGLVFPLYAGTMYDLYCDNGIPPDICETIFQQATKKLKEMHALNIVHGDIKPENIAYEGTNPLCQSLIDRFHANGGFAPPDNTSLEAYAKDLIRDLFEDNDYNYSDFSVYNSSNESEDDGDDETSLDDLTHRIENLEKKLGIDEEEDSSEEEEESSEEEESEDEGGSESDDEEESWDETGVVHPMPTEDLKIQLIDFSHTHEIDDDSRDYVATRYYRCPEVLRGEGNGGFFADWYALACTMSEIANGTVLIRRVSDDEDDEDESIDKETSDVESIDKETSDVESIDKDQWQIEEIARKLDDINVWLAKTPGGKLVL
jgi:serine/threonine protein kinase